MSSHISKDNIFRNIYLYFYLNINKFEVIEEKVTAVQIFDKELKKEFHYLFVFNQKEDYFHVVICSIRSSKCGFMGL